MNMSYETARIWEAVIIFITGLCAVKAFVLSVLHPDDAPPRIVLVLFAIAFGWLLFADLAFWFGSTDFVAWPQRPAVHRTTAVLAFGIWLWWVRRRKKSAERKAIPLPDE